MTTQAYFQPATLEEALNLLSTHGPTLLVMAGGTLAMPLINEGISFPEHVMSLRHLGLNKIEEQDDKVTIGAATTMSQIIAWDRIALLSQAANEIGGWAIRNMGTVGGNLFAPPPAGDFAAALLALDAQLKIINQSGERIIPLDTFYTGFMMNELAPRELVAEVHLPWPSGSAAFLKYGRKKSNTPSIVTVAVSVHLDGGRVQEARIGLNAVGPHPFRARKAESSLVGKPLDESTAKTAGALAAEETDPFTDAVATAWYRRKMTEVYVKRALLAVTD